MLRFGMRFIGVEVLLWGIGLMFLPTPKVVVLVMAAGAVLLISERLSRADCEQWIRAVFPETLIRFETTLRTWAIGLSFVLVLLLALVAHHPIERRLWMSGNFGEPEFNRGYRVGQYGGSTLVEFMVEVTEVQFDILLRFRDDLSPTDYRQFSAFLAPRGMDCIPQEKQRIEFSRVLGRSPDLPRDVYHVATMDRAVSTERSLYIVFPRRFVMTGCGFGDLSHVEYWGCGTRLNHVTDENFLNACPQAN